MRAACPNHPDRHQFGATGHCLACHRTSTFTAQADDPAGELEELAALGVKQLRKLAKQRRITLPGAGTPAVELAAIILGVQPPPASEDAADPHVEDDPRSEVETSPDEPASPRRRG